MVHSPFDLVYRITAKEHHIRYNQSIHHLRALNECPWWEDFLTSTVN